MHSGQLTADSIQPDYYFNLAKKLTKAVAEGLGGSSFGGTDYRNTLKAHLDHNMYAFSGAKSLEVLQQYKKLLLDEKGEIKTFSRFKSDVLNVDNTYNVVYLEAEYENAIARAQMAEQWENLKNFTLLEFRTTGGENVCPICGGFDRVIFATKDKVLIKLCPPLHFKCHCSIIPAANNATATDREHVKNLIKAAKIQPYFRDNPGISKVVYTKGHPYFKYGRWGKLKDLDAERNYGMDDMDKIYAKGDFAALQHMTDKSSALQWWQEQAGALKNPFEIKAADGLTVTFDNDFRNHVLEANRDNRYTILHAIPDVLKKPDEIWSRMYNGQPSITYIKYYKDAPVVVHVDAGSTVRGATMVEMQQNGKINIAELTKLRKGQLKFRK